MIQSEKVESENSICNIWGMTLHLIGVGLRLNKFPLPKNALCQVNMKLFEKLYKRRMKILQQ